MIQSALKIIFGSKYERDVKRLTPIVEKVSSFEPHLQKLSDLELANKTLEFKERLANKESLDDILPEAFAVVREASQRTLGLRPYDVQIMGGIVLHEGQIAEMKTGEGKTLTSTLPIYLNALTGKGVHVVTVNDYLARRDAAWMGPLYSFLGMKVGVILSQMSHDDKINAYNADITYGTNNEFGFDYLRDNMVEHRSLKVQRGQYFAIIDEVDSVLIDEARTPLIISGSAEQSTEIYARVNKVIPQLQDKNDYEVDEKARNALLTEIGVTKCEKLLGVSNLYDPANVDLVHHIQQALKAYTLFEKDVDYVVQNNEVLIVDEFTGRLMEGRRYSDGLHQALEAKERVEIKNESQTLASITFQNLFRMYEKLGGMTGTADTEAEEFRKIYNLNVTVLPPNKVMVRIDQPDRVYRTEREKFDAIAEEVKQRHIKGQPVLVGTVSIENSEKLSRLLNIKGIPHAVLNAKFHEKEAEIVKDAGQKSKVTIATNMAGRGTDIVLGEGVKELGGLYIIGSERHESRRIDNQLRGRSGRQGDPGETRFYLALEDNLMRIFGTDRVGPIMQKLGMEEGEAIEHRMVSSAIEKAQKRVEAHNFEIRKHLLEYDDVMNKQRRYIYSLRNEILEQENISELIHEFLDDYLVEHIALYISDKRTSEWDIDGLISWLEGSFGIILKYSKAEIESKSIEELSDEITKLVNETYNNKEINLGTENMHVLERIIALQVIDQKWKEHLYANDHIKEGVWTMGYAQKDPLVEYRFRSFEMFEDSVSMIKEDVINFLFKAQIQGQIQEQIPTETQVRGVAFHQGSSGYGVNPSEMQKLQQSNMSVPQVKPKTEVSKAAQHTAGGASARKSNRRKKR
ncbi:MAG: preprotein translocase subunit SecA [Spirochaetia bacterium]|nr:preprotein translocase subunit SecA [Spirochaetia bacterium]